MPDSRTKAIIFDLVGVLIELTGVPRMLEWLGWESNETTTTDLWNKWLTSPAVRTFEQGKSTPDEFARSMVAEFGLPVEPEQFLAEFKMWPSGWFPDAEEIIRILSKDYTLASLSNSNSLHWVRMINEFKIEEHFQYNFPSHLTGFLKPDREAFEHAIKTIGIDKTHVLFIDDNAMNVDAALNYGIRSFCISGVEELRSKLGEIRVL